MFLSLVVRFTQKFQTRGLKDLLQPPCELDDGVFRVLRVLYNFRDRVVDVDFGHSLLSKVALRSRPRHISIVGEISRFQSVQ